jgi:hypothetical protein
MTDAQIFQLLGLTYVAISLGGIFHRDFYQELLKDAVDSPSIFNLYGLLTLTVGFLLITFHNQWSMSWSVIITIFGWVAFIEGILMLAFPSVFLSLMNWMQKKQTFLRVYVVIGLLLGIFFLLLGFGVL